MTYLIVRRIFMDAAIQSSTSSFNLSIQKVVDQLAQHSQTVALAFDFIPTGDFLQELNQVSVFAGAVVAPTDDAKNAMLGIPYQILNVNGAKSEIAASWMAKQLRNQLKTSYGIGIVENQNKRMYWLALSDADEVNTVPLPFRRREIDDRKAIQKAFELLSIEVK